MDHRCPGKCSRVSCGSCTNKVGEEDWAVEHVVCEDGEMAARRCRITHCLKGCSIQVTSCVEAMEHSGLCRKVSSRCKADRTPVRKCTQLCR